MNTEKIGKFISIKRKEKKLTQKELAEKLGVTDRAVSKWERGMGCPDISYLEELSKILNISIVELLNGEEMEDLNIIEKDLINSMGYSKMYVKDKIKNTLNIILTAIIIFVSLLLIIINIINSYKLNKKYNVESILGVEEVVDSVEAKINIILNNQGIYTDEEYQKIIKYANKVKSRLNNETKDYLFKSEYTMKEYYEFQEYYNNNLSENPFEYQDKFSLYYILLEYDKDVVDSMLAYQSNYQLLQRMSNTYDEYINSSYKYNLDLNGTSSPIYIISTIYLGEENLLKEIIEVGDMDE